MPYKLIIKKRICKTEHIVDDTEELYWILEGTQNYPCFLIENNTYIYVGDVTELHGLCKCCIEDGLEINECYECK